jgi:hypothetical protein
MENNSMTSKDVELFSNINCPLGLNMIDGVTLAYMVNTSQYEKYLKKNHIDDDSYFSKDIRFYRKRIVSLTKDLFKNHLENDKNQNVLVGAFNMYIRACISFLKFSDQSEMIQKCYVCQGEIMDENSKCVCKNKNENNIFELHKANELCFKPKEVKKITLDNYVIRKNAKKSEPVFYPKQFTFNPRDPEFKYKGLKTKAQTNTIINEKSTSKNNIQMVQYGENIVINNEKSENIKNNNKKKNNKIKKKVSFDVTNSNDNI